MVTVNLLGVPYQVGLFGTFVFHNEALDFYEIADQFFGKVVEPWDTDEIIRIGERALFRKAKEHEESGLSLYNDLDWIDVEKYNQYLFTHGDYWHLMDWEIARRINGHEKALTSEKVLQKLVWHQKELDRLENELRNRDL